ncbi:MAG: hypothetical protein IKY75_06225 [Bacteroidaceae bacterium]|nr:hypothetical protein [Bacteroidaceae bacterium]
MKKLVYILSLAIGLLVTGCAQWENMESLPRDTWGPEPELAIEVSPLDSITGELISDKMDVVFYIKNATNFHFVYAEGPEETIDYTALLKGQYGGWSAEPALEGDTLGIQLTGFVPGNTYTVYAVAANAAGVQTTAVKTVGAVDVTAPVITTVSPLTATANGKQVTIVFNENIIRTDAMPAVTYDVLDENLESYATGDASAMASGKNLVVTLPATFNFNEEGMSIVLLSFGEGSVEDKYGNKMAAIANVLDDEGLPNGPWWAYDPANKPEPPVNDSFFQDGKGYAFVGEIDLLGGGYQQFGTPILTMTYVAEDDEAVLWHVPSILNMFGEEAINEGAVVLPAYVPAYSYTDADPMGGAAQIEILQFLDVNDVWGYGFPYIGDIALQSKDGSTGLYPLYMADYVEGQGAFAGWSFGVYDFQGQGGEVFKGSQFVSPNGGVPYIIAIMETAQGPQMSAIAELKPELQFHSEDILAGGSFKVEFFETPIVLDAPMFPANTNAIKMLKK